MSTHRIFTLSLASLLMLTLASCGRKPRQFFHPDEQAPYPKPKISALALPAVKGVRIEMREDGNRISWQPLKIESLPEAKLPKGTTKIEQDRAKSHPTMPVKHIGYNLYRFALHAFVPKDPVNAKPLTVTTYHDRHPLKQRRRKRRYVSRHYNWGYLVRGVFSLGEQRIEGPASQIVTE